MIALALTPVFSSARNGQPTCSYAGRNLHSTWDPEQEARRFIDGQGEFRLPELPGSRPVTTILILGACMGYLASELRKRHPGAAILSLQFSPAFRGRELPGATASWYPDSCISLDGFLTSYLDDDGVGSPRLIAWPPAEEAFSVQARAARESFRNVLDRIASSAATIRVNGKRWIRNACRSFLSLESTVSAGRTRAPVLVLAAGPSLAEAASALAAEAERFLIIAVSSALSALLARGIEPDIVISTDPGFWSQAHLSGLGGRDIVRASPFSACPVGALSRRILILDQGWFPEHGLSALIPGSVPIHGHGTVAGSALSLAASLSEGPIVVAGFDFASNRGLDHAPPHAFDDFVTSGSRRILPIETKRWDRLLSGQPLSLGEGGWRTSRSLKVYAASLAPEWLHGKARGSGPGHSGFFRLCPSPMELPGFDVLETGDLDRIAAKERYKQHFQEQSRPPLEERRRLLAEAVASWRAALPAALKNLRAGTPPDPDMADLLRSVDLPWYAAVRRAVVLGKDPGEALQLLESEAGSFVKDIEERYVL